MTGHVFAALLLATIIGCGFGTVSSRCQGPQCLGENEHALTCAPTPAPSPFEHHDPVPPPNPLDCRPPDLNPGGVNGTRSERVPESDSRLAR